MTEGTAPPGNDPFYEACVKALGTTGGDDGDAQEGREKSPVKLTTRRSAHLPLLPLVIRPAFNGLVLTSWRVVNAPDLVPKLPPQILGFTHVNSRNPIVLPAK